MSDDLENVSVVETTAEQSVVGAEPVEPPTEELPAEIEATQINLAPADDVLTQNAQQAYAEQYMPDRAGGNAPITAAGHAAKAAAEDDKKSDLIEHLEQSERRKDWLERDHDFGGMRMSGHDLAKMIDFISNPHMQDKLRERLGKSGVPKEKADKGMKELNEYIDLKKKEQDGGKLTEEQHRRLKEVEKSEEFKVVAKQAQEMRNEMDLKTGQSRTNEVGKQVSSIHVIEDKASSKLQSAASFESYSPSGIPATAITDTYNVAAAANKNEIKAPAITVAQENVIANKTAEVAGAGFTV